MASVTMDDEGADLRDAVEAKSAVLNQLSQTLDVIAVHAPTRVRFYLSRVCLARAAMLGLTFCVSCCN